MSERKVAVALMLKQWEDREINRFCTGNWSMKYSCLLTDEFLIHSAPEQTHTHPHTYTLVSLSCLPAMFTVAYTTANE